MKRKKFSSEILLNNDTSFKKEKTLETCLLAQRFLLKVPLVRAICYEGSRVQGNLNESVS